MVKPTDDLIFFSTKKTKSSFKIDLFGIGSIGIYRNDFKQYSYFHPTYKSYDMIFVFVDYLFVFFKVDRSISLLIKVYVTKYIVDNNNIC